MGAVGVSFTVRAARPKDTGAILELNASTLADHIKRVPDHFTGEEPPAKSYLDKFFRDPGTGFALVAEQDGKVIGWTGLNTFKLPAGSKNHDLIGLIVDITVLEIERRKGVGTALIDRLIEEADARGVTKIRGDVWRDAESNSVLTRAGIVPVRTVHEKRLRDRLPGPMPVPKAVSPLWSWAGVAILFIAAWLIASR